ncbi:hypothetical protein NIIDMKKI_37930 [Mycobacterium kansasii]|uniref:Xylose isomerase-like TIM barrel family protein n=1 Tax=Mycobacterium kansasii TaxID=1768 RepID=A0A7G1ICG9_MYCKA|nr:hypothetical protein NIIDMKKI_37930 [Mycobacterium kansasii]
MKHKVYQPDWTTPDRLEYTRHCAEVLSDLLAGTELGTISTLPLGWSNPWDASADDRARQTLAALSDDLRRIEQEAGHRIRMAIEPEPGCVIGSCRDAIGWFGHGSVDTRYIGLCLDTCHLAVMGESPAEVVAGLADIGIDVVKIQASNAIQIDDLAADGVAEAFAEFAGSLICIRSTASTPTGASGSATICRSRTRRHRGPAAPACTTTSRCTWLRRHR